RLPRREVQSQGRHRHLPRPLRRRLCRRIHLDRDPPRRAHPRLRRDERRPRRDLALRGLAHPGTPPRAQRCHRGSSGEGRCASSVDMSAADIPQSPLRRALPFATLLFLLVAAHGLLETARDGLFLMEQPVDRLPWLYLAVTAAVLILTPLQR